MFVVFVNYNNPRLSLILFKCLLLLFKCHVWMNASCMSCVVVETMFSRSLWLCGCSVVCIAVTWLSCLSLFSFHRDRRHPGLGHRRPAGCYRLLPPEGEEEAQKHTSACGRERRACLHLRGFRETRLQQHNQTRLTSNLTAGAWCERFICIIIWFLQSTGW